MVFRFAYTDPKAQLPVKVTTWDALGYYMYLPAQFIYHDEKQLNWFPAIDSTYSLSGGELYQANRQANGNFVFKYLEGVSMLQAPFFLIAHSMASMSHYPADGFSAPYQYAIAWGCIFYCLLALFLLRNILLRYYKDGTVALTLILLLCGSNFIQYVAIEGGQSHGYIFPLYVFLLYATIKWHENRKLIWSFLMAFIIGLAVISRPTEAVMIFIPLLWGINSRKDIGEKMSFVFSNRMHLVLLIAGFISGVLPQLLYWKRVTGSFVYDVGSKWDFLNPHFRVLFGFEKGWFIYTPVTLLFVAGLFFMNRQPFKRSVITFCLLNIYIIIAWHIWRYGGSYSCRALVQSYPVFALPLAGLVETVLQKKWKVLLLIVSAYLVAVNLFQIRQYNQGILHYDDMNAGYYRAIYLNPNPTASDMSLLDTKDRLTDGSSYHRTLLFKTDQIIPVKAGTVLFEDSLHSTGSEETWYKIEATIQAGRGLWESHFVTSLNTMAETKIRLSNPLTSEGKENDYVFFIKCGTIKTPTHLKISLQGNPELSGQLSHMTITGLSK